MSEPKITYKINKEHVQKSIWLLLSRCIDQSAVRPNGIYRSDPLAQYVAAKEIAEIASETVAAFSTSIKLNAPSEPEAA